MGGGDKGPSGGFWWRWLRRWRPCQCQCVSALHMSCAIVGLPCETAVRLRLRLRVPVCAVLSRACAGGAAWRPPASPRAPADAAVGVGQRNGGRCNATHAQPTGYGGGILYAADVATGCAARCRTGTAWVPSCVCVVVGETVPAVPMWLRPCCGPVSWVSSRGRLDAIHPPSPPPPTHRLPTFASTLPLPRCFVDGFPTPRPGPGAGHRKRRSRGRKSKDGSGGGGGSSGGSGGVSLLSLLESPPMVRAASWQSTSEYPPLAGRCVRALWSYVGHGTVISLLCDGFARGSV